jgi:hypothetical protein
MFIRMVTWFFFNQPPASFQTTFNTEKACEAARNAVLADQRRLKADQESIPRVRATPSGGIEYSNPIPAPTVSAVCVAK